MISSRHTVQRAIVMAAGKGERLRPITSHIPKPMIPVNGTRMIESIILALKANGINEIYVVTGYKKEAFTILTELYPEVRLIENPFYETCNNISSLYVVRDLLQDCMILDGDLVINNPAVLSPHFTRSGYNAVWTNERTTEWLLKVEQGVINSCSRTGGTKGWQLYSISRWNEQDGRQLQEDVTALFESGNHQIYWDDVPLFCNADHYSLGIREMEKDDVIEIDSFEELVQIDQSYSEVKL